jgi:hypothetical protein
MAEHRRQLIEHYKQSAAIHAHWKRLYLRAAWNPGEPLAKGPPPVMPPPPPPMVFLLLLIFNCLLRRWIQSKREVRMINDGSLCRLWWL